MFLGGIYSVLGGIYSVGVYIALRNPDLNTDFNPLPPKCYIYVTNSQSGLDLSSGE